MKKLSLLLITLYLIFQTFDSSAYGNNDPLVLKGKTKSNIYLLVNEWFVANSELYNLNISFQDKEEGVVIGKFSINHNDLTSDFSIQQVIIINYSDSIANIRIEHPLYQKTGDIIGERERKHKDSIPEKRKDIVESDKQLIVDDLKAFLLNHCKY